MTCFRRIMLSFVLIVPLSLMSAPVWAGGSALGASGASDGSRNGDSEKVLQFGLLGNPDTLDPHATTATLTFQTVRSIYDTLAEPDENGVIVPALAESWRVSEDNLTWTFTLRPGVVFHNGDVLDSGDAKATLERLVSPESRSGRAAAFSAITAVEAPDEGTVVLRLSEPKAALLAELASGWGAILPKSLIDAGHDFGREPVGTGPFRFVEWIPDNRIGVTRNMNYWMPDAPRIDGVVFNIIPEGAVMVQGLINGDLDAVETVSNQDRPMLEANPDTTVHTSLSALVMVLAMNTGRSPMDNVEFRRATARSIDKRTVMDIAYGGGEVVNTFMDYGNPYYMEFDYNSYDPEGARAALADMGYDGSVPLTMKLPENYQAHVTAGEMYQEMLEAVGIDVELQLVDWSTWLDDVYRGRNFDLTVIGHTGKLDPSGRLGGYGSGGTYVQWTNAAAAEAIQEAGRVADVSERRRLYGIALEQMSSEVPHVYVGSMNFHVAARSNVTGLRKDARLDTFDFRFVEMGDK